MPVHAPFLDIIQFIFHAGGEGNVHNVGKVLHEHIGDFIRYLCRHHVLSVLFHVFALV